MLDSVSFPAVMTPSVMTEAWRDHLAYGDIVLFRFPLSEGSERAPVKARPCLVLDIVTLGIERFAMLAYGTTSRRRSNIGEEIHVRRRDAFTAAGLDEPTRFIGKRPVLVRLTHSGFILRTGADSPVLGQLEGRELDRLNAVRGRIHALRDIAAEHRCNRSRRPVANVIVEPRHPKRRTIQKGAAA